MIGIIKYLIIESDVDSVIAFVQKIQYGVKLLKAIGYNDKTIQELIQSNSVDLEVKSRVLFYKDFPDAVAFIGHIF